MTPWREEPISKKHDLKAFVCSDGVHEDFLIRHALRSHEFGGQKTFLAIDDRDDRTVIGFYSLGSLVLETCTRDVAPWGVRRRRQPGFRLTHLAVNARLKGRGLGGQLLVSAGRRCLLAAIEVGGVALFIEVADERGASWFARYGAMPLLDTPRSLLLPLASIEAALRNAGRWSRGARPEPQTPEGITSNQE